MKSTSVPSLPAPTTATPSRRRVRRQFDPTHPLKHHPSILLGHEKQTSFDFVRQAINEQFSPQSNYHQILSEVATQNIWRALRSAAVESAAFDTELADQAPQIDRLYEELDSDCRTYLTLRNPEFAHARRLIKDDESAYTRRHFAVINHLKRPAVS